MAKEDDDVLPPEVRKQVEEAKAEGDQTAEVETEAAPLPEPEETKESRRARKQREREEHERAITERAEQATRIAEELRAARAEDAQRLARLEQMLQERAQPQQREEKADDWREKYDRQMKKAREALAAGNLDEYHERMSKANAAQAEAIAIERAKSLIPQQQPQPQAQKAPWVQAVESQFPDVVMHQNGFNAVVAFANLDPSPMSPEKLQRAFTRARQELGLVKQNQPDPNRERQRQMLSSGPTNGSTRGSSMGGGKGERVVNGVPKNYKEIARAAGMTPEAYVKAFASMNPGSVGGRE